MDSVEILFAKPLIDEFDCTTDACIHIYGGNRTVLRAGAALHTGFEIDKPGFIPFEGKDLVRTDLRTPAATDTDIGIQLQSCHITQIAETFHSLSPDSL